MYNKDRESKTSPYYKHIYTPHNMNSSSHNTIGKTDKNNTEKISDVLEQIEEINHHEEIKIETGHTLDHTPVLSDDMQIFSYEYDHKIHNNEKQKKKIKAFFSYFAGGISIFALSVFGFISGAPSPKNISANLSAHTEISEEFKTEDECLLTKIKQNSHAKLEEIEKICSELFTKKTH